MRGPIYFPLSNDPSSAPGSYVEDYIGRTRDQKTVFMKQLELWDTKKEYE